jgi:hypothetical protein
MPGPQTTVCRVPCRSGIYISVGLRTLSNILNYHPSHTFPNNQLANIASELFYFTKFIALFIFKKNLKCMP